MKKILIVEDEKILMDMYKDKFVQVGFNVVTASSAEEGLEKVVKENPDLVLLDILLPKGNGISFLKKLRKDPKTSFVVVVAFSNFDDPEVKAEALSLGVKDYLLKTNYTPQEIIDRIKIYAKNS
ncbi:MAG: response regulator [bacterium]